ncbi:deoxynucleoside kinase [Aerococcus urinae]|uniref:deoxynucleoside kinase n=1 Tax=Aerococcus urinae TaxID=1376 RepID=UPI0018E17DF0|nr:deoxynucleoside kinase [Aerococcus urinae]
MIVFAGTIGAGKSTYAGKLAEYLGTKVFYEPVEENPILDKYYQDPKKYAFSLQIYFLNQRFKNIKAAFFDNNNVLDRSIYEDELFTYLNVLNGNISEEEFGIYRDLLANMMEELDSLPKKVPDLLVFLDSSLDNAVKNIKKRGRVYEQPSSENGLYDYYRQLHSHYGQWYADYDQSPKMRLNVDNYDIHRPQDAQIIFDSIGTYLDKIQ